MNIGFTYNVRHLKPSMENEQAMIEAEFDEQTTIDGIAQALRKLGHEVYLIEADENCYQKFQKLKPKIDLVFNIAEGIYGQDREAQIPAMLEMLQIKYVGSKPLTQAICLNKGKTKEILKYNGIATPNFQVFKDKNEKIKAGLNFPLFVKPNQEGSSKGILQNCLVNNEEELRKKVEEILTRFKQPALAEEYLAGREFTVALIGNDPTEVLPIVEIDFSDLPKGLLPVDSYEVKWLIDNPESKIETVVCPAKIDQNLLKKIENICLETKKVLDVLDLCRIDVRLDKDNNPNILEINQIPGIIPDPKENSRFPLAARTAGYNFEQMLEKIIRAACQRYNIVYH